MKTVTIGPNDAGQRLDKFLQKYMPALPVSMMYKYIRKKRVKLNRKKAAPDTKLWEGDVLDLYISDEFFANGGGTDGTGGKAAEAFYTLRPNLEIAYEDAHILIVNKPAGVVVHEDEHEKRYTLIDYIKAYLYQSGSYRPEEENSFAPALCNRIDRNTSGLVIAAKTAEALRVMNQKIRDKELSKYYLCIVHGEPSPAHGTIKGFLKKDAGKNKVFVLSRPEEGARTAITKYRTLETRGPLSLLEVELITGRTHQIRAHMASIGHPLLGDGKYGTNEQNKPFGAKHQALCAYRLIFHFTTPAYGLDYLNGKTIELSQAREQLGWTLEG